MINDTLYSKYISERLGASIIEANYGFITYKIAGEECFINDMFVERNIRKAGMARALIVKLEDVARAAGCKVITANVFLGDKNSNSTLIAALLIGFELKRADAGVLLIAKEIREA